MNDIKPIIENIRELLGAIFIQEQRNYDMLMIIAEKLGADANKLLSMHEIGEVLAPSPSFAFNDEINESLTLINDFE